MALNAAKVQGNNKDRIAQPDLEAGAYPARLVQVVDFGLQAQRPYQGKDKPPANEICLVYEMSDVFMVDEDGNELPDKPRWVSETIPIHNLAADKAKSTQRYLALDPQKKFGGDFSKLVGTPVNITIVINQKDDKKYINIAGITAMRAKDADKCPPLVNDARVFDLDDPNLEVFKTFAEWIQNKIKGNLNYQGSKLQALLEGKVKDAPPPPPPQEDDKPW